MPHPPFRGRADRAVDFPGDRTGRHAIRSHQNSARFEPRPFVERTKPSGSTRSSLVKFRAAGATRTEPIFAR
jgi:hypothetical protein